MSIPLLRDTGNDKNDWREGIRNMNLSYPRCGWNMMLGKISLDTYCIYRLGKLVIRKMGGSVSVYVKTTFSNP